jgi:D-Tyr-tRNAtyr deacylase
MNKIILLLAFVLTSNLTSAQSVFDKFDGQEQVTSIIVNKKMFDLMSKVKSEATDKETLQYFKLIKKLDNLKVFVTSSNKIGADMKKTADSYLKTSNLEELMRVTDSGRNVKIYVKSDPSDSIKELFMYIDENGKENQTIIMSLTGNFELNEISSLTNKMNLPGGDLLKKASKTKK